MGLVVHAFGGDVSGFCADAAFRYVKGTEVEEGEKGEEDGMRRMRTCSRNLPSQQNLDNLTSLKAPRSLHSICFGFVFF